MKTSQEGIDLIKSHESLRLEKYLCPAKKWTIGYGHVILPNENYEVISEQIAEDLLKDDLKIAESAVTRFVKVKLNQYQFDALVSFIFNIGVSAFSQSTLLKVLNSGLYPEAAQQFLRWNKSKGIVLNGLVKRRKEESNLFLRDFKL